MFIGREDELRTLEEILGQTGSSAMIYGKRKVGKTTLIKEALKRTSRKCVYYECIKDTLDNNLSGLVNEISRAGLLPEDVMFREWRGLFRFLASLNETLIIVIDEYPYLKTFSDDQTVDSLFQSIIDNFLSSMSLIISGSHISMMKDLLEENNALYGRFTGTISLKELDFQRASRFYPGLSSYDKAARYAVFGGSPYICGFLRERTDLKNNIIKTILNQNHPVYIYADNILFSEYSAKGSINAGRIFSALGNGKKKYGEIEAFLSIDKTGNLNKQLRTLVDMEIVSRRYPINRPDDAKKSFYEISDNLLRFFYTYIYKNKSALTMIGPENFYDQLIAPTLTEYISRRFEDICRDWFSLEAKAGRRKDIRNIGCYYYDDPARRRNGEFDVALEVEDGYEIYEAKYLNRPLSAEMMQKEESQIADIPNLKVKRIGFISMMGFEGQPEGNQYITGDDLYRE